MSRIKIEGTIDLHIHSHPCLFPRIGDDRDIVTDASSKGMKAIMLKCHHESTVSRARELDREFGDIAVHGGIVLNYFVGGINPQAVEAALKLGAKAVWMPTIDADNHAKIHGSRGKYDVQDSKPATVDDKGITIFEDDGTLTQEIKDVVSLVIEHNTILGTSHLSKDEIFALVKYAAGEGLQKILITHPFFKVPSLSEQELVELTAMGATAEFGFCSVSPMWNYASIDQVLHAIRTIGLERAVLMSDAGQVHNPMPAESLRVFAQCLHEKGLSEADVYTLLKDNPEKLLA